MPGNKVSSPSLNTPKSVFSKDSCTLYPISFALLIMMMNLFHWQVGFMFPLLTSSGLLYLPQLTEWENWCCVTSRLDNHKTWFGFHPALPHSGYAPWETHAYRRHWRNLAAQKPPCWRYQGEKLHRDTERSLNSFSCSNFLSLPAKAPHMSEEGFKMTPASATSWGQLHERS